MRTGLTEANTYVPLRWLIRGPLVIVNTKQYNLVLFCGHKVIFHTVISREAFLGGMVHVYECYMSLESLYVSNISGSSRHA